METTNNERLGFINSLIFENTGGFRYTQDNPILANVWINYALQPRKQQELILTLEPDCKAGEVVAELREMLTELRRKRSKVATTEDPRKPARIAYIPGQIAVKLYFDELMRVVLPLTPWWHDIYQELRKLQRSSDKEVMAANWKPFPQDTPDIKDDLSDALINMRSEVFRLFPDITKEYSKFHKAPKKDREKYINAIPSELCWVVRIAGIIGESFHKGTLLLEDTKSISSQLKQELEILKGNQITTSSELKEELIASGFFANEEKTRKSIVHYFTLLFKHWSLNDEYPTKGYIAKVTKNRRVHLANDQSRMTIKADAAKHLFNVSCKDLTWAVIDSGIDCSHPAFKNTSTEHFKKVKRKNSNEDVSIEDLDSRITQVLDFTRLRELLSYDIGGDNQDPAIKAHGFVEYYSQQHKDNQALAKKIQDYDIDDLSNLVNFYSNDQLDRFVQKYNSKDLKNLRQRLLEGKEINWEDLEPLIATKKAKTPVNDHGTHVAGILAADWVEEGFTDQPIDSRPRVMQGVCPDIKLIDVRVFREDSLNDEFELLAAIQFLRWMNSRAGTMQVHGANISLSLVHEVRRFACGQTPICVECNEAVSAGMVIVAAAGNRGFEMSELDEIRASDNYKSVSITDPGNAEKVITVGATHYKRPHEYGVSYFSSRGPTGDGRMKPDLIAPGEKVFGPTVGNRGENKDGTSMAAPHVSGAAAMLMARYSELIAQPEEIKTTLCETATDLGRERYFQGGGLLDVLRALQSR